ncbi:MAG: hypothetical protein KIS78_02375 [Labilithrix sp.]|nr:hypothetical protein [Labilithrix sp.]
MTMRLRPDEIRLDGEWKMVSGQMVADAVSSRIATLVEKHLEKVAANGWDTLYRDPQDGRYWELLYLHSERHGGGPPSLVQVTRDDVKIKYGLNVPR